MNWLERVRSTLQTTIYRITGSSIELEAESTSKLSSRCLWQVDDSLMRRIAEKRARLPANSVKRLSPLVAAPKSRLIEDQPDYPDDAA